MPMILVNGSQMFYKRSGDTTKPAIIFVHGITCDHSDWDEQVAYFQQTHDVIAVDLNGHGQSDVVLERCSIKSYAEDVIALTVQLLDKPAVLVGHSMGSRVVMQAAALRPELYSVAVLVDGSRLADPQMHDALVAKLEATINAVGLPAINKMVFEPMFGADSNMPKKAQIIQRAVQFPEVTGRHILKQIMLWDAHHSEQTMQTLTLPVKAIQTTSQTVDGSRTFMKVGDRSSWLDFLQSKVSDIEVSILEDTGHFPMQDKPTELNHLLIGMIAQ